MSYSYCRLGVLAVGAICAVLTGVFSEPGNINTFHPALLLIFPLTMGALWCWQRGGPDARGYGVSAVLSALAFLLLPLSTVFGPIFPALVGLIVLGCFKSDLYYLLAAAASFAALFFGNINTRLYLGTPRRYIEAGAEPSLTFITLGLLMVTLGLIAVAVHSRESLVGDIGTARP